MQHSYSNVRRTVADEYSVQSSRSIQRQSSNDDASGISVTHAGSLQRRLNVDGGGTRRRRLGDIGSLQRYIIDDSNSGLQPGSVSRHPGYGGTDVWRSATNSEHADSSNESYERRSPFPEGRHIRYKWTWQPQHEIDADRFDRSRIIELDMMGWRFWLGTSSRPADQVLGSSSHLDFQVYLQFCDIFTFALYTPDTVWEGDMEIQGLWFANAPGDSKMQSGGFSFMLTLRARNASTSRNADISVIPSQQYSWDVLTVLRETLCRHNAETYWVDLLWLDTHCCNAADRLYNPWLTLAWFLAATTDECQRKAEQWSVGDKIAWGLQESLGGGAPRGNAHE